MEALWFFYGAGSAMLGVVIGTVTYQLWRDRQWRQRRKMEGRR